MQAQKEGKFPFEKLIKHYPYQKFEQAIGEMKRGEVVKPVLLWS